MVGSAEVPQPQPAALPALSLHLHLPAPVQMNPPNAKCIVGMLSLLVAGVESFGSVPAKGTGAPPPAAPPPAAPPPTGFTSKVDLKTAVMEFIEDQTSAENTHGFIADWNVSRVSDMSKLFYGMNKFDANITKWDTSSVTDMYRMFDVRSARAPLPPQPPVLNPTLKRAARAAAASHALPPPNPHLAPHRLPSFRLGRAQRRSTSC